VSETESGIARRRFSAFLRPWRFEPAVLAVFFAFASTVAVLAPSILTPQSGTSLFVRRLLVGVTVGITTYAYFKLAQWILQRLAGRTWAFLILSILYAPICLPISTAICLRIVDANQIPLLTATAFFVIRMMFAVVILSALIGRVYNRIDAQRLQSEDLRTLAEAQRKELLAADERVRSRVSTILHDRFQSELVTSSLMLANVAKDVDPIAQDGITTVIGRLNALHSQELREVLVALGPDLHHVDLQTALAQLARQYEPAMTTAVHVDDAIDSDRASTTVSILLGLYRITEQALLNAVKHGQACHASVTAVANHDGVRLTVENDGRTFSSSESNPGNGTAVIASWCGALGGSWSIGPRETGGAVLVATIPNGDLPAR